LPLTRWSNKLKIRTETMKNSKNIRTEAETLAKYLSGEMDETEAAAYLQQAADSGENYIKLEKMKKQWSAIEGYNEPQKPDTTKAWNKLYARLQTDNLIPGRVILRKNRQLPALLRVAAVVIIMLAVGTVIYLNKDTKPTAEMVQLSTGDENNTLIKTLNDGSVIYLAQNSLFSFPNEFETKSRNVGLKGEAFFDIAPNPDKPFIIETDEAFIQVLGTAFNVKTKNGSAFELSVDRGKVKVSLKNNPGQIETVMAGEKISNIKNSLVKSKQTSVNSWYRQRMHFKDESLQNIISVLNRNFNTTFVVAEKETGNRKLTVTFDNETVETMTELICVTLNLKYQTINGSVVLSEISETTRQ